MPRLASGAILEHSVHEMLRKTTSELFNISSTTEEFMPIGKKNKKSGKNGRRWVAKVTTDSTHPPPGLFTKSAGTIVRTLASKKVSPKGLSSAMRMLTYFINRGGRGLSAECRRELEKAKSLLSNRIKRSKKSDAGKKMASI
jgi:hypothetical protein